MPTPYYENDYVKLYKGDCLQIMPELCIKVNAVIADIPYFQIVKNDWDNQFIDLNHYLSWCNQCFSCCYNLLYDNSNIIIFTGRQYNRFICSQLDNYFREKRIIIWNRKRQFNQTRGKAFASGYEPICFFAKGNDSTFNNIKIQSDNKRKQYTQGFLKDGVTLSDSWNDIPSLPHNSKEKENHPTQKPTALIEYLIKTYTNENETVLDFTAGSGTTGVACMNTNRKCVLIEKQAKYCEITIQRLQDKEKEIAERLF